MDGITLTQKALQLNVVERVRLIDALWHSLDSPEQAEIDQAWLHESQNRLAAYQAGHLQAIDGQRFLSDIETFLKP